MHKLIRMNPIKSCLFITSLFLLPLGAFSQELKLPSNVVLKTEKDFRHYEKDVLAAINWLEQTPLTEQTDKRREAAAFVTEWISNSPYVTVKMYAGTMVFYETNPDLLVNYMGGWVRYALANPSDTSEFNANMAGLRSVITVYRSGKGIKKDTRTEKLVKLEKDGKLEAWAREHFKD